MTGKLQGCLGPDPEQVDLTFGVAVPRRHAYLGQQFLKAGKKKKKKELKKESRWLECSVVLEYSGWL